MDNFVQIVEEHYRVFFFLFFLEKEGTIESIKALCTAVASPVP